MLAGAGARWSENAGGASGALWGAALTAAGNVLGDQSAISPEAHADAADAFIEAIIRLGGGQEGEKTMIDAQVPFARALRAAINAGATPADAWREAAQVAVDAAAATADMRPTLGRARVLAERSLGHADPGATSFGLVVTTIAGLLAK